MARVNSPIQQQELLGLIETALRVASNQISSRGENDMVNVGNTTTDVDVRKNNQRSDTDQDLYTDKNIWVLSLPIQYCPVIIEQEDFDGTESSTAQSRGILTKAENNQ